MEEMYLDEFTELHEEVAEMRRVAAEQIKKASQAGKRTAGPVATGGG